MTQPPNLEPQTPREPSQHPDQNQAAQLPGSKPTGPSYEFTLVQDNVIRALSKKMNFVGYFYVVASALVGLAGLGFMFVNAWIGLFYMILLTPELLIGIWTLNAGKSFRLVVDTMGQDIPHLMNALGALRRLYTLMFWILIIGLVFMVLAIVAVIVLISSGLIPMPTESTTITSML
ncbi:MAG: hypothetical protein NTZ35_14920 [Ignavibacteriales bacterium]|nr:hypothetical protein [Ignavibacteriales bacterium]